MFYIPMGNRFLLCSQKGGIAVRLCLYAEPIRCGFVLRTAIRQLFQDDRQMGFKRSIFDFKGKCQCAIPPLCAIRSDLGAGFDKLSGLHAKGHRGRGRVCALRLFCGKSINGKRCQQNCCAQECTNDPL